MIKKGYAKVYVRHGCGHTMMADTTKETVCECGYRFTVTDRGTMSAMQNQKVAHPYFPNSMMRVLYVDRDGKRNLTNAGVKLSGFRFNIGRVTKKLLAEIKALAPNIRISTDLTSVCSDGRTRPTVIHIDYIGIKRKTTAFECWISLECPFGKNPNNKEINERLRAFRDDLKAYIKEDKKPEKFLDSKRVVIETAMEYAY